VYSEKIKQNAKVLLVVGILAGYGATAVGEYQISPSAVQAANPYLNPYEARSYPNKLEVYRGDKRVSVIRSEKPNIERWGFIDSGNLVVVKSRGEDGVTIFELFDTATGALRDKAISSDNSDRLPIWAVDFIE
jgi:hypothetical protein